MSETGEEVAPLGPPPAGDGAPLEAPRGLAPRARPPTPVEAAFESAPPPPARTYDDVPDFMSWVGGAGVETPAEFEYLEEAEGLER